MAPDLSPFADLGLTPAALAALLGEPEHRVRPGLDRLWEYYRNPQTPAGSWACAEPSALSRSAAGNGRGYRLAQERGLPARLASTDAQKRARETVIENDIGWRIDALVDFIAGNPPRLRSLAPDPARRALIEHALDAFWLASGGPGLVQDFVLLGLIYGGCDLILRAQSLQDNAHAYLPPMDGSAAAGEAAESSEAMAARVAAAAGLMSAEVVDPQRAVPITDPTDYRRLLGYVITSGVPRREASEVHIDSRTGERHGLLARLGRRVQALAEAPHDPAFVGRGNAARVIEVVSATHRRVFIDGVLVEDQALTLGVLPVVHVQNASQPFCYAGQSDVEPMIPLQDELNTRLSDRAHRVTLQSFNMYLAKGLDGLQGERGYPGSLEVAPGQVWITDNPDADIKAFGGDGHSPSEDRHIDELREALDKSSSVSPVVIGVIRERLGHLSSENALRLTMLGILSKTARRRVAYGGGLERLSTLALQALDTAGVLRTTAAERRVRAEWSDPLPASGQTRLSELQFKRSLGVPDQHVLDELGTPNT